MTRATLSERLADHVCSLDHRDIPPAALAALKRVMAHDLLMGLLAGDSDDGRTAHRLLATGIAAPGPASVFNRKARASPADAAFANAVLIRALRQASTMTPALVHAGAVALPVALALAEQRGASGSRLLEAVVAAFDVCAALDDCAPERRMYRTPSHLFATFGAAAAAAKMIGLDRTQTAAALAHAGNMAVMIMVGFEDQQYGIMARNALLCAFLAEAGAPARRDAIEGDHGFFASQLGGPPSRTEGPLAGIDGEHAVTQCLLKPVPGGLHAPIGMILLQRLRQAHGFAAGDVAAIIVHRGRESNDELKHAQGPFASRSHAISSVPLTLAGLLRDGRLSRAHWDRHDDPELLGLCRLVTFRILEAADAHEEALEVHLRNGAVLKARGGYELLREPPDPEEIIRFHGSAAVDADRLSRLGQAVDALEADGPAPLAAVLRGG